MKKILIPVETKDRLPDKDGVYRTDHGFAIFNNGKFTSCKYGDVLTWLEEVSEEEYLKQKMKEVNDDSIYSIDDINDLLYCIQSFIRSFFMTQKWNHFRENWDHIKNDNTILGESTQEEEQ
jgi:hypothetical protein